MYASAVFQLIIAIGIGTVFSSLLTKTGLTFPIYIGAMLAAALIRNISEYTGKVTIHMGEINDLGGIALSLFLGMAMITLKLWELASLALPMLILLGAQVLFMVIFTYFIEFNVMGRDYDAAVLVAGTCGFGMGATPNAMANMQAICNRYVPSVKAYLIIPLVGSLFADFINSLVITFLSIYCNWEGYMLFRKSKEKKTKYDLTYDNVAIPEVHTHPANDDSNSDGDNDVLYDNVAIPEVHIHKK